MKSIQIIVFVMMAHCFEGRAQEQITDMNGIEFVFIKPGSFLYGRFAPPVPAVDTINKSYSAEHYQLASSLAKNDSRPGFTVQIPRGFYLSKYEITQDQWTKIMGSNPSVFNQQRLGLDTRSYPVESVDWNIVQKFIRKLNKKSRNHYRLPSEFEWEYAARAGASEDISWNEIRKQAHLGTKTTNPVGLKEPNAWGLYDMLGNVWEWVHDYYNEKIFADPIPPKSGKQRVLKGASFTGDVKNATFMTHAAGPGNTWDVGFRLVMETKER